MTDKFLKQSSTPGAFAEGTGVQSSAGSGDAGKLIALNSSGQLDTTMLPTGVGAETKSMTASEALAAGAFVNIYNASGTVKCRNSDASASAAGKQAHGFVLASVSSGATATVYISGINNQLTGLTGGSDYFVDDTTAGAATATAPTTTGHIVQYLGTAISATEIPFERAPAVILA